ncbi:MAG: nickel-dependent lactate racemase [Clostridiaceae bacterium]|nr:nickel-dependent lactate racemase [Clostridiaceae bacterium]
MELELGYGDEAQRFVINDKNLMDILVPNVFQKKLTGEEEVRRALLEPIGAPPLRELVKPGEKIVVVTSDLTRPMPTPKVMPALLDELYAAGVRPEDITLVFALGNHRKHTEQERRRLAGERAWTEITCVDSDPTDCIRLGTTKSGTPVDVFRLVARADRRICLGNIEYHYFAGYSGGAKAIMPGVSSRDATQSNHSMMILPYACTGRLEDNPVRMDIEEAANLCGVDYIVNVVLDEHKEIIFASAGDVTEAHRAGCRFLDDMYRKPIANRGDIVIASQGGAPKDIDLYQTQKALDNAKHAVKKGGIIILVGSCKEGLGGKIFETWMLEAKHPRDLIHRVKTSFELGGHKAAAIALVLEDADIYLVSDLDPSLVRRIFLTPFATVQDALDAALRKMGENAQVIVMPYAGSTLPECQRDSATY